MGHRIELSEIESAIAKVNGVEKVVVLFSKEKEKIYAFYMGDVDSATIVKELRISMPAYMIPGKFEKVEKFDLTENGKTDRKKLAKEYEL